MNRAARKARAENLRLGLPVITWKKGEMPAKAKGFKNMSAVEKIKAAAAELGPEERVELFRWWVESPEFKQGQLAALKREIDQGIGDLENGRYRTYDAANAMQLAEEVGQYGRERLKSLPKNL